MPPLREPEATATSFSSPVHREGWAEDGQSLTARGSELVQVELRVGIAVVHRRESKSDKAGVDGAGVERGRSRRQG
jgi:hypothetical protein